MKDGKVSISVGFIYYVRSAFFDGDGYNDCSGADDEFKFLFFSADSFECSPPQTKLS
jgi:hypothetical protein